MNVSFFMSLRPWGPKMEKSTYGGAPLLMSWWIALSCYEVGSTSGAGGSPLAAS